MNMQVVDVSKIHPFYVVSIDYPTLCRDSAEHMPSQWQEWLH